jgi:hypothetical protein
MAKAPLYTVTNLREEPRFVMIGVRKEPIEAGRSKDLPIADETAQALAADGFKVIAPDGKVISAKKSKVD